MTDTTQFFRSLDLMENPIVEGFNFFQNETDLLSHYRTFPASQILKPELIQTFQNLNLFPSLAAIFYKAPGRVGIIHSDVRLVEGRWIPCIAAVNWRLRGTNLSTMNWFEVDLPTVEPKINPIGELPNWYYTLNGLHFGNRANHSIPSEKIRVMTRSNFASPTLVRTNRPHSVDNLDRSVGRWTLSLRFDPDFSCWDQAVEAFQPLLK